MFKRLAGKLRAAGDPGLVWQPAGSVYPRLLTFRPSSLTAQPGLYLLWHLGVRPQWLRVGFSTDLGAAATLLAETPAIAAFEVHDGPFWSWSPCAAAQAGGYVAHLTTSLKPILQAEPLGCDVAFAVTTPPVACPLPPGVGKLSDRR